MKKIIFMSLVLIVQFASAQKGIHEVKRLTVEQSREKVKNAVDYIEKLKNEGKSILTSPDVRKIVIKSIEATVKDVTTLSPEQTNGLLKLVDVNAAKVLPEIARLASISKASSSSAVEKSQAKKSIELISLSSHLVETLHKNEVDKKSNQTKVEQILELSDKVASIASGELASKSADFVKKYEKALKEGKSLEDAVREASGGKFTLEELLNCK
ncbi:MAG: hypothetical protein H7235_06250 [Bdellovibrionaceae bacterium]|nr:hypothetical protein [Pseudobdellovibrionaceae bacterium]